MAGYHGDLKAKKPSLSQSSLMFSLGAKYDLTEHIAARSYLTLTSHKADDKKGTAVMQDRNLNFQTKILKFQNGEGFLQFCKLFLLHIHCK